MELFKGKNVGIIYGAAAVALAIGTFADFQISGILTLLNGPVATFVAAFGEFPWLLTAWVGAGLMLSALKGRSLVQKFIYGIVTLAALLFGCIELMEPYKFLGGGALGIVGVAIEVAISIAGAIYAYRKADTADSDRLLRVALVLLLIGALSVIVVNVIKSPWGRPRYRSIVVTEGLEFQPWYVMGTAARDAFEGILPHEEFKSFPSGHSCSACCLLALTLLPSVISSLKGSEKKLAAWTLGLTLFVMVFRIVAGAHFLSDVTIGFTVTYTLLVVLYQLVCKKAIEREAA